MFESGKDMKSVFSVFILISMVLPAAAERGTASQRAACTPDVFRLCSSEIPDVDGIVACLRREKAHLSAACRLVMSSAEATRSLAPKVDLCDFGGEPASVDEIWRAWCKGR